ERDPLKPRPLPAIQRKDQSQLFGACAVRFEPAASVVQTLALEKRRRVDQGERSDELQQGNLGRPESSSRRGTDQWRLLARWFGQIRTRPADEVPAPNLTNGHESQGHQGVVRVVQHPTNQQLCPKAQRPKPEVVRTL